MIRPSIVFPYIFQVHNLLLQYAYFILHSIYRLFISHYITNIIIHYYLHALTSSSIYLSFKKYSLAVLLKNASTSWLLIWSSSLNAIWSFLILSMSLMIFLIVVSNYIKSYLAGILSISLFNPIFSSLSKRSLVNILYSFYY